MSNQNGSHVPTSAELLSRGGVTSAFQWRRPREEGFLIRLPSGNTARLRPVALDVMLASGKLPDLLTPIAAQSLWTETNTETLGQQGELAKSYVELINAIVPAAMMCPTISATPTADDEISLSDLDFSDKVAIFQLVTQPVEVLRRFRDQQSADVELVHDSQSDGHPAQPASTD